MVEQKWTRNQPLESRLRRMSVLGRPPRTTAPSSSAAPTPARRLRRRAKMGAQGSGYEVNSAWEQILRELGVGRPPVLLW